MKGSTLPSALQTYSLIAWFCLCCQAVASTASTAQPAPFTLQEAISQALANNPGLKESEAALESSKAQHDEARADFLPRLSTQYSYTRLADQPYQRVSGILRYAGDENTHHWDVSLTQSLFAGFALISKRQMTELGTYIQELQKEAATIQLIQNVRISWYETLLAARLEHVAGDAVAALGSHLENAQGFFRQGLISKNDLLKAEVSLAQARQDKERSAADRDIARTRLSVLLGGSLPEDRQLAETGTLDEHPYQLANLTTEALENNPGLKAARLGLQQADQAIRLAGSTAYPTVSLAGRYEQNGSDPGGLDNAYTNEHNTSVSLNAKWDFFDAGRTGAKVAQQRAERRRLAEKINGSEDQLRLEVKRSYLDLQVAATNITTAQQGLTQARENWRITELQYTNQVATTTDVLDSRTLLNQSETYYAKALYGYSIAEARLFMAIGRK